MKRKHVISFEIDDTIRDQLVKLAQAKEMSVSGLLRFIIKEYLKLV